MECIITECLDILIEILLIRILFIKQFTKSKFRHYTCTISILVLLGLSHLYRNPNIIVFFNIIISVCIAFFLLEEHFHELFFSFLLIYIITSLMCQTIVSIGNILWRFPMYIGMGTIEEGTFSKTITGILLTILFIIQSKKKYYFSLSLQNKVILSAFTGFVCIFVTFLHRNKNRIDNYYLHLFAIICVITTGVTLFYMLSLSSKNYEKEKNNIQSRCITTLKSYYTQTKQREMELRKIKHDMKNHINVLTALMASSNYEKVETYLQQINDFAIFKVTTMPDTGNVLVNAILLEKSNEFADVKINFKGALKNDLLIKDYDLTTIIGNLLDNALEYSHRHHFPDITLYIYQEPPVLLINISNQVAEQINLKRLGKYSSKPEPGHGFGIINVKESLYKYHGQFEYTQEQNLLTVKVQLYL